MILPLVVLTALAAPPPVADVAAAMVPRGKVIETYLRDYVVKTNAGTKVTVEFTTEGRFAEASGKNLNQGDDLEPGEGLLSLSSVAQHLSKSGIKPRGLWALERDPKLGWIYEFDQAIVDAKTGRIVKYLTETRGAP
jgi:hypothetical protein